MVDNIADTHLEYDVNTMQEFKITLESVLQLCYIHMTGLMEFGSIDENIKSREKFVKSTFFKTCDEVVFLLRDTYVASLTKLKNSSTEQFSKFRHDALGLIDMALSFTSLKNIFEYEIQNQVLKGSNEEISFRLQSSLKALQKLILLHKDLNV